MGAMNDLVYTLELGGPDGQWRPDITVSRVSWGRTFGDDVLADQPELAAVRLVERRWDGRKFVDTGATHERRRGGPWGKAEA